MTLPLIVLAFFSVFAGFAGLPGSKINLIEHWLKPVIVDVKQPPAETASSVPVPSAERAAPAEKPEGSASEATEYLLMLLSLAVAIGGILLGRLFYLKNPELPRQAARKFALLYKLSVNKWYWDYLLDVKGVEAGKAINNSLWDVDQTLVDGGVNGVALLTRVWAFISGLFDKYVVDLAVNAAGWITRAGSVILRSFQTGFWQNYALLFTVGLFIILLVYERGAVSEVVRGFIGK